MRFYVLCIMFFVGSAHGAHDNAGDSSSDDSWPPLILPDGVSKEELDADSKAMLKMMPYESDENDELSKLERQLEMLHLSKSERLPPLIRYIEGHAVELQVLRRKPKLSLFTDKELELDLARDGYALSYKEQLRFEIQKRTTESPEAVAELREREQRAQKFAELYQRRGELIAKMKNKDTHEKS